MYLVQNIQCTKSLNTENLTSQYCVTFFKFFNFAMFYQETVKKDIHTVNFFQKRRKVYPKAYIKKNFVHRGIKMDFLTQ